MLTKYFHVGSYFVGLNLYAVTLCSSSMVNCGSKIRVRFGSNLGKEKCLCVAYSQFLAVKQNISEETMEQNAKSLEEQDKERLHLLFGNGARRKFGVWTPLGGGL